MHYPLWRPAEAGVIRPIFEVPRLQHLADQLDHPLVMDFFPQGIEEDTVVNAVEASHDVPLDEPLRAHPVVADVVEGVMTAEPTAEPEAEPRELRLIEGFE